jgi:CYTH domain-containing protein
MGSGPEIERRFIIKRKPDSLLINNSISREVGYVFNDVGELRVVVKKRPKGPSYQLTIKDDGALMRNEWQEKIPHWAFAILWPKTDGNRLQIIRHFVKHGDHELEVDEYLERFFGLHKLECEFESESEAAEFVLPSWAENAVEVTDDPRFNNKNLAALDWDGAEKLVVNFLAHKFESKILQ